MANITALIVFVFYIYWIFGQIHLVYFQERNPFITLPLLKTLCYNNYLQSNCNSNLTHTLTRSFNLNGNLRKKSVGLGLSFSFLQELKIRLLILMDLAISGEYLAVVKPLWYPTFSTRRPILLSFSLWLSSVLVISSFMCRSTSMDLIAMHNGKPFLTMRIWAGKYSFPQLILRYIFYFLLPLLPRWWSLCGSWRTKTYLFQGHPTSIFGKYLFGRRFEIYSFRNICCKISCLPTFPRIFEHLKNGIIAHFFNGFLP